MGDVVLRTSKMNPFRSCRPCNPSSIPHGSGANTCTTERDTTSGTVWDRANYAAMRLSKAYSF